MVGKVSMAGNTISSLEERVDIRLRPRAGGNNGAMEEEARTNLHEAVDGELNPKNLVQIIEDCVASLGGVELELPPH